MVLTEDPLSAAFETVPQRNLSILHNDSGFYTRVSKKRSEANFESKRISNHLDEPVLYGLLRFESNFRGFLAEGRNCEIYCESVKSSIGRAHFSKHSPVKSDQSGAGDFLISIGVFCKIYVIPYVLYNFFSGGQSPAHNINYLLHHEICGTLGNCLNGNLARILFSCISVNLIMILAFPALVASWGVMYIIFVSYFDQPLPMVTEYVDDPTKSIDVYSVKVIK
ncbi:hypothetical protein B9Z55_008986 [Caenorhabditis nigoni]|uniref:Uncharacterized protein n=1 Tax=Caenorhabditis nigoni TaxID=1611254 RepID=A0A2G5UQ03_9PELO|nr:hypothetical protein B9Z55_008986 [Caenorhabditis nigoni]